GTLHAAGLADGEHPIGQQRLGVLRLRREGRRLDPANGGSAIAHQDVSVFLRFPQVVVVEAVQIHDMVYGTINLTIEMARGRLAQASLRNLEKAASRR